jgi:hypothetical protein
MNAFNNGWQGVMGWTSNGVDDYGTPDPVIRETGVGVLREVAAATNGFRQAHPQLVFPTISGGTPAPAPAITAVSIGGEATIAADASGAARTRTITIVGTGLTASNVEVRASHNTASTTHQEDVTVGAVAVNPAGTSATVTLTFAAGAEERVRHVRARITGGGINWVLAPTTVTVAADASVTPTPCTRCNAAPCECPPPAITFRYEVGACSLCDVEKIWRVTEQVHPVTREPVLERWAAKRDSAGRQLEVSCTGSYRWIDHTPELNPGPLLTIADIPSAFRENFEWLWNERMPRENSTRTANLIFDQVFAGEGSINWAVRWESNRPVTLAERRNVETMLQELTREWFEPLAGYECWPFDDVTVRTVGWSVHDAALIVDRQPDEQIWVNRDHFEPHNWTDGRPATTPLMSSPPAALSRFVHFRNGAEFRATGERRYQYPGGLDARFDMILWASSASFGAAGHGGDWGTRMGDSAIVRAANGDAGQRGVVLHEIGHGFGLYDFYGAVGTDRPPATSCGAAFGRGELSSVMIVGTGSSRTLTPYDEWMIRYWYSMVRDRHANRLVLPETATTRPAAA